MAATLRATVLQYKSSSIPSKLSTVQLKQDFVGDSLKDKKCPVFNGEHGIDALLYIAEQFRKITTCTLLSTTGLELFDRFKEVFLDTMLTNWEDLILPMNKVDKTPDHFEQTLEEMHHKYVEKNNEIEPSGSFELNVNVASLQHQTAW
jgi:hypothetical protein